MLEEMDGEATDNEQSLQYEKGLHTFSILFTRWMDSNDWSHPIMVSLAKAAMSGTGWLHSSQISGLRHAKLRSPGPRTFIAIERLNYHLYQYTQHKTLIPGTGGSNFYANALPILEDGKPPELGWWFEVFCGQRIPTDERLLSQYVSGYDAETCSKNWGRLLRKLMADNGLDIFEDLSSVIQKHYPAGLTLEWNGEQLSSSQEPVTVYYPAPFKEYARTHEFPEYLGHISTNADTTLPNLDAFFTITRTDVLIPASNGEIARAPIAEVIGTKNYTINQESPNKFIEFWETNKRNYLTLFSMLLPLGMYFFIAIQRVVMLCIEAFLFYLFKKISGVPWSYATSVKYAMHIFVPAELVSIAAQYATVSTSISFFSLTVWIYFIAVLLYPAAQVVMKRRQ